MEEALANGAVPRFDAAVRAGEALTPHERMVIETFERAAPSVACVQTSVAMQQPFTLRATEVRAGAGSGFVWDSDGHVVTNWHVIAPPGSPAATSSVR